MTTKAQYKERYENAMDELRRQTVRLKNMHEISIERKDKLDAIKDIVNGYNSGPHYEPDLDVSDLMDKITKIVRNAQ